MLLDVPYRDDREALRERNRELEEELARARAELRRSERGERTEIEKRPGAEPLALGGNASAILVATALGVALVSALAVAGVELGQLWLVALAPLLLTFALARSVVIAGPHEAVVLGGIARQKSDGTTTAFRVVRSARVLRSLIREQPFRLDLGLHAVRFPLARVRMKDGVEVDLELGAVARIDAEPSALERAVERFLGSDVSAVRDVTKDIVISNARRLLAETPSVELARRPRKLAEAIRAEAEHDFAILGLVPFVIEILAVRRGGGE